MRAADSTRAALRILEDESFDALVSDIGMPLEDGYALIEKLRSMQGRGVARLPAVALTAYASAEDHKRALAAGYDIHVAKPIEPGRLVSAVVKLTRRRS